MSEPKNQEKKTPDYIRKFIEAVYPEAPDLALASFNEKVCLEDATALILSERSEVAALEKELEISKKNDEANIDRAYAAEKRVEALEQKLLASEVRGGELVEALKKIAKHAQDVLEWNSRTGGTLVASAESYMALEALTTWNSLKGETEGK